MLSLRKFNDDVEMRCHTVREGGRESEGGREGDILKFSAVRVGCCESSLHELSSCVR